MEPFGFQIDLVLEAVMSLAQDMGRSAPSHDPSLACYAMTNEEAVKPSNQDVQANVLRQQFRKPTGLTLREYRSRFLKT